MKWFKKKIRNWLFNENNPEMSVGSSSSQLMEDNSLSSGSQTLHFKVFNAVGGHVVEFRRYDHRTDRVDNTTYIINKDQDFGERISKIATMENLK